MPPLAGHIAKDMAEDRDRRRNILSVESKEPQTQIGYQARSPRQDTDSCSLPVAEYLMHRPPTQPGTAVWRVECDAVSFHGHTRTRDPDSVQTWPRMQDLRGREAFLSTAVRRQFGHKLLRGTYFLIFQTTAC